MKAILEIDLPECCEKCPVYFSEDDYCLITEEDMLKRQPSGFYINESSKKRGERCPLIIKEGE